MVVYEVPEDKKTGTLRAATESYSRGHQIKDVNNYKTVYRLPPFISKVTTVILPP